MYKIERLSDDVHVAVSNAHTFGTDALLLADYTCIKRKDKALDMGSGCGIIPLLWLRDEAICGVHALDIQESAIKQIEESVTYNGFENRLFPHLGDLRQIEKIFLRESFTLVTMNPPYKPVRTGIESMDESAKIARHEVCCNIDDVCKAAAYLLKNGGRFCMCHRPERLLDVTDAMRKYKLEPKRLRFVQDKKDGQPFLFLIEGKKGTKPFIRVEPQLIIKKDNGKFSDEMLKIYGSYADGYDK